MTTFFVTTKNEIAKRTVRSEACFDENEARRLATIYSSGGAHRVATVVRCLYEYANVGPIIAEYRDGKE